MIKLGLLSVLNQPNQLKLLLASYHLLVLPWRFYFVSYSLIGAHEPDVDVTDLNQKPPAQSMKRSLLTRFKVLVLSCKAYQDNIILMFSPKLLFILLIFSFTTLPGDFLTSFTTIRKTVLIPLEFNHVTDRGVV